MPGSVAGEALQLPDRKHERRGKAPDPALRARTLTGLALPNAADAHDVGLLFALASDAADCHHPPRDPDEEPQTPAPAGSEVA
jgi:hypothetical protein